MNIKRSYFQGLLASVAVGLLLANCTIKESSSDKCDKGAKDSGCSCSDGSVSYQVCNSDGVFGKCVCDGSSPDDSCEEGNRKSGCECASKLVGYQVCDDEGVFGSCVCPSSGAGGTGSGNDAGAGNVSGSTSTAGTTTGGTAGTTTGGTAGGGNTSGEGGAGGTVVPTDLDPEDCNACLAQLCPTELSACLQDEQCISEEVDGSGQYERISACIEGERLNGVVKRDAVRGCGVTVGVSPDASLGADWAPEGMSPATTNLLNCLATSAQDSPNADWANSDDNFPVDGQGNINPTPWPEDSCAKLACTGKID
jgi:hypothetical protein